MLCSKKKKKQTKTKTNSKASGWVTEKEKKQVSFNEPTKTEEKNTRANRPATINENASFSEYETQKRSKHATISDYAEMPLNKRTTMDSRKIICECGVLYIYI